MKNIFGFITHISTYLNKLNIITITNFIIYYYLLFIVINNIFYNYFTFNDINIIAII